MPALKPNRRDLRSCYSLLLAVCRRGAFERLDPGLLEPLTEPSFRRGFLEIASTHRVMGRTLSVLLSAVGESGSENRDLVDLLRTARRRSAVFEIQRDRVVSVLGNVGVRFVLLKGAAIALTLYDRPFERDFVDLDLLVPGDQVEKSLLALGAEGYEGPSSPEILEAYRRYHFHVQMQDAMGHFVEVHWRLTRPSELFQLDSTDVLSRALTFERPGRPVLVLPRPEHTLLHLVIQNLHEGFSRLARLMDIDRIVARTPDLDWDALVATALKGNLASATAVSLQLATRTLGATVPGAVLRELRPAAMTRFHLATMRPVRSLLTQRLPRTHAAKRLNELWLVRGVRKRMRLLGQMLTSDTAILFPQRDRPGFARRWWRLGKLIVLQAWLYGAAAAGLATREGRAQTRFW